MCDLDITWIGVSEEVLHVTGTATGTGCDGISATLTIFDASSATVATSTVSVRMITAETWEALFALAPGQRDLVCGARYAGGPGELGQARYKVEATCGSCGVGAARSTELQCCPRVESAGHDVGECVDRAGTGVLRRLITVRWRVTRLSVAGRIVTRARLNAPGETPQSADGVMAASTDPSQSELFSGVFVMPTGVDLRLRLDVLSPFGCQTPNNILVRALDACDCSAQPESTDPFRVLDDATGTDLSTTIDNGGCITATTVRIEAPADARGGRFIWDPPATADPMDRFATVVEVPDTDDGVTVTAQVGSDPCTRPRSVTIRRCQPRPPFCSSVVLPCGVVEAVGVIAFYFSICIGIYVGLSLIGGATARGAIAALLAELAAATAGTGYGAAIAAIEAEYAAISAAAAAWAGTIGLIAIAIASIELVVSLVSLAYWTSCCAPRSWYCRFMQNLDWTIKLFVMTALLWDASVVVVCALFDMALFAVFGVGLATMAAGVVTSIVWIILQFIMWRTNCPTRNIFDPPFLS